MWKFITVRVALAMLVLAGIASAQFGSHDILWVTSAPSGTCTNGSKVQGVVSTGVLYTCQSSTWAQVGGSGGSAFGSLTGGTNTGAVMVVGTGASLAASGTGTITATGVPASGITATPISQGLIQTGLLAEYRFNEGTGTTLTDYSGNSNNGTFCASGPAWTSNPTGLSFNGSSNCINLPSALNVARSIILVTTFSPGNATYQAPVCGNTSTAWGGLFRGVNQAQTQIATGGEFLIGSMSRQAGGVFQTNTIQAANGTQLIAWNIGHTGDSTGDKVWVNNSFYPFGPLQPSLVGNSALSTSATGQTTGNYVLGGSASGSCMASFASWWPGIMSYAVFYSTYLTQAQIGIDFAVIANSLAQRGLQISPNNVGTGIPFNQNNQYVALGDSITYGAGETVSFPQYIGFNNSVKSWNWLDIALPSSKAADQVGDSITNGLTYAFYGGSGNSIATYWIGTNDCNAPEPAAQVWANIVQSTRGYRSHLTDPHTQKIIGISMISRAAIDACKNSLNALFRQQWPTVFDGFADMGADPNLGADGDYSNLTYFLADQTHLTTFAKANDAAPVVQRAIRRVYGNNSWTAANTYTTAAAAAVATTAGSEATNTVTITFGATPANCVVGSTITIAGTTPAGYSGNWQILTRSATQVTYWDVSGLGAITIQGTGVCPQQVDEDVYVILAGSATSPSFTLESCMGYTGQNLYIKNENTTSPWVITPFQSSETIDGAASLTMPTASSGNFPVVVLQSTLISPTAAGCTWSRLQ